ncbi:MAG: carbohydrate-binding domain-containing protein [Fibrobacter sp.]|nr:carbohydrate-binding domain-containing protein [Fibrobacter sp.]
MKTAKILSCGILSILFIACGSDSSGTAAQTDELADGSVVAPDGGVIGSSGSVDFTSSANTDPFDTSFTGRSYALISSATFGISSSSTGLIGSSAGGSANPGIGGSNDSPDTEEDDVVSLDGSETTITFSGTDATVTNDNGCLTKGDKSITVTCSGNYYLQGTATDFQVIVSTAAGDTGKVDLFLNGVSLKSSDAPIYVQNAEKAELHLVQGTTNTIEDGSTRPQTHTYNNKVDTAKAAIYAKDDLSIKGSGSLTVKANYNNGIHTSNDLKIEKSTDTLNVTAKNCGLKGKASLTINGGNITVNASGDGIKSDEDDTAKLAEGKGLVKIAGGTITITSAFDGISASNTVQFTKGETTDEPTAKITAGGGQTCLGNSTSSQSGRGGWGMMGGGNSCSPDSSMKGIKADSNIVIEAGKIDVNSHDDGIHSDGNITVSGGFASVKTDDDGLHSEKALTIKGGTVEVTMAYEGMEGAEMNFEGGVTSVVTTNDGWNAAGGTSSSTGGNQGGRGGGFGRSDGSKAKVTGGFHYIYVGTGDTDGLDSNGDIDISGGVVVIECRMNGGMGGMVDSDGSTSITGGKLLGFGTNNSEEGTQYSVNFTADNYYGTSDIAFKPSFSGSKMVSNVGQPGVVNSVDGMQKQCFGSSTTNCVYYK